MRLVRIVKHDRWCRTFYLSVNTAVQVQIVQEAQIWVATCIVSNPPTTVKLMGIENKMGDQICKREGEGATIFMSIDQNDRFRFRKMFGYDEERYWLKEILEVQQSADLYF